MKPSDFEHSTAGVLHRHGDGHVFVPDMLPPELEYDAPLVWRLALAERRLGELNGLARDAGCAQCPGGLADFVRVREAAASLAMHGQSVAVADVLAFLATDAAPDPIYWPVRDTAACAGAMVHALERLDTVPLSAKFLRDTHAVLMKHARSLDALPGRIRAHNPRSGPLGNIAPPPPDMIPALLGEFDDFLLADPPMPLLVQAALLHWHFRIVHPFSRGNGRTARLLVPLFLAERGALTRPLLDLSTFLFKRREEYRACLLDACRGLWAGWLDFFLRGVIERAEEVLGLAEHAVALHAEFMERLGAAHKSKAADRLAGEIFANPVFSVARTARRWGRNYNFVKLGADRLAELGIVKLLTGGQRNHKLYCAHDVAALYIGEPELLRLEREYG